MRPDRATVAAFIGVVVFGGLNGIAVKKSLDELAPFWSAGARFLAAGLLLTGFVLVTGRQLPRGRSLSGGLLYGIVGLAAAFGLIYPALGEVPVGTVILFLALVPLETFGLAILHRQERFHPQGLMGALIALAGVAVVVADQLSTSVPIGPMLLALAGTLFIAESAVILKWVPRSDPFATNAVAMLGGGMALLAVSLVAGEAWIIPSRAPTWLAMGYLVLLGSIAMFGLFLYAVRRWTASAVSYVTLLMPLVTIPLAALLIGERVSILFVVGGLLAVVGVYVGAFLRIRPGRSSATSAPECMPVDNCGPPVRASRPPRPATPG
ncbi:MAG TPA: EamA family transporter [Candidatus Limnocylindrales bacterium]|nr:EamA family transporter [Candidatus Limnocylindrales bacterium]